MPGVSRFVHCGTEASPLRPDSEAAYRAVKAQAEAIVLAANAPEFAGGRALLDGVRGRPPADPRHR
jgi:hypothetical protein